MSLILGLDPSLSSTGWSILDFDETKFSNLKPITEETLFNKDSEYKPELILYGTIDTNPNNRLCKRVYDQKVEMEKIIKNYNIDIFACEDQFAYKNYKTLKRLSHVRGQYMSLAAKFDKPFILYTPKNIKLIITGYGKAKKNHVMNVINNYFNINNNNDNISDAIAVALSYIYKPENGTYI